MGAVHVVPGVSGGTVTFISGIYKELIDSIKNFDWQAIKLLFSGKFYRFHKKTNGDFLLAVISGTAISIFSFAKLTVYLLVNYPIQTWSFFFGLIIVSSILVAQKIKTWDTLTVISLLMDACIAYTITVVSPGSTPGARWFILLSGTVTVCAMILPSISGTFTLLLMGKYAFIMTAVGNLKIEVIATFAAGMVIGIIGFSHLLSWLLKSFRTMTMAWLTGFMVGSLNKVWPWKEVFYTYNEHYDIVKQITIEKSISPAAYAGFTQQDPLIWQAVSICLIGFVLFWSIEIIGKKLKTGSRKQLRSLFL